MRTIDRDNIRNKTEQLLKDVGITKAPVPVIKIANSLGIDVRPAILKNDVSGYIEQLSRTKSEIVFNEQHPYNRIRFTIAHEIGHYILHLKDDDTDNDRVDHYASMKEEILYRNEAFTFEEREANIFAAELLMPLGFIESERKNVKYISEIASLFEVSQVAMRIRLENLEIKL